ncbi:unnamed protein product [Cladocopium goreaui]|uniref:Uncharacterized protein n=1 Tax=Cladocopium goreaui TaxID=2562237 RepID=A0A9P1CM32_9DINO|nr:unnamed protein product [Cladocopium goreaui]
MSDRRTQQETLPQKSKAKLPQPVVAKAVEHKAMPVQRKQTQTEKLGSSAKMMPEKPHEKAEPTNSRQDTPHLLVSGPPCTVFSDGRHQTRPVTPPKAPAAKGGQAPSGPPGPPGPPPGPPPSKEQMQEMMRASAKAMADMKSPASSASSPIMPSPIMPSPRPMMMRVMGSGQQQMWMPPQQPVTPMTIRPMVPPGMPGQPPMQTIQPTMQPMQPMQQGPTMVQPVQPTMVQPMQPTMVHPMQPGPVAQTVPQHLQQPSVVERFCNPKGPMKMQEAKASTEIWMEEMPSGSAGSRYEGGTYIPAQPQDWKEWNEDSKKAAANRGHRHTPTQVRREAFQREAQLREHYEAKLAVQKEWYEAKLVASRAEVVAAKAIMLLNGLDPNQTIDQQVLEDTMNQPAGKKARQG